ncbi:chlorohydrolase family protein [Specibacter cremeus]|uniref:chlorohydrolase family protein n=1 Tax=Specibacter cremeus TaxID=1629051 RepID=UPI000F78151B|nr:chlorohydrolase family protein [Specibacter cremeus]
MRTCIRADHVLGHENGRHVLIAGGQVVYEDDSIVYVGPARDGSFDETLELGASLITPGLIDLDALTDIDHLVLDSWAPADRAGGLQWSEDYFERRRRDVFTPEERQVVREYALVQLALHGITTYMPIASEVHSAWAEGYDELVGMTETSRRLGLRAYLGPAYRSGVNIVRPDGERAVAFDEERGRAGLADALRFLDYTADLADPLVTGALLPCRIETLSEELMVATASAARSRNVMVRLHALQGLLERRLVRERFGVPPLQLLERTGLLGDNLLVPHGLIIDRNPAVDGADHGDLATLAAAGVSIIHCPQTSFRYGSALHSFGTYLAAGVNLCLGTDSFPPDLVRGMDVGVHLAKIVDGTADAAPAERYFEAATLGGARALHRADLGRLEAGAQADLVAFSLADFRDGVLDDPVRTLLLNGTARSVTHSVVAGRMVVRDGEVPGVDLAALRARAQALFARMRAAYSERDTLRRGADELFPPTFPAFASQGTPT